MGWCYWLRNEISIFEAAMQRRLHHILVVRLLTADFLYVRLQEANMSSMEVTLRGEVKRLREENSLLQKEAARANQLKNEVEFLRNVTLLQHEEKVPIRLRELEQENLSLRRRCSSLEERLRTLEAEDYRSQHVNYVNMLGEWNSSPQQNEKPSVSEQQEESAKSRSNVSWKQGHPCGNCTRRVAVVEKNAEIERGKLTSRISELEEKLKVADGELDQIRRWVSSVVATYQQFPTSASSGLFPSGTPAPTSTNSFLSPQRHVLQHPKGQPIAAVPSRSGMTATSPNWASEVDPPASYLESHRQITNVSRTAPHRRTL